MYGFIGVFNPNGGVLNDPIICEAHSDCVFVQNEVSDAHLVLKRLTINKFINDKILFDDNEVLILVEGVIFNFIELEEKYNCKNRGQLLKNILIGKSIKLFASELNGYFAGVVFDKRESKIYLIADHISYRTLWYAVFNGTLFFGTDIDWLYRTISKNGYDLKLDYDGAYCLLNHGYMLGDITPVMNVKKLLAGNVLLYSAEKIEIQTYYNVTFNSEEKLITDDLLEEIDYAFSNAVLRAYKKDDEYGYKHCITLSGGLDSRLVLFMAKRLGFDTLCITMGEAGCPDILISSKICDKLRQEHLVYELNNGIFLLDFDSALIANGGTILSPGFLHSFRLSSLANLNGYGLLHTGDLGDLILGGSFLSCESGGTIDISTKIYATSFIDGFSDEFKKCETNRYDNQATFNYYNRGLNSAGNGCFAAQFFTECSAPFIDKELLNIISKTSKAELIDHKLYINYMKKFLPNSCEFIWEATGCKPTESNFRRQLVRYRRGFNRRILHKNDSMNPFEYYYDHNPSIRNYFEQIYNSGKTMLKNNLSVKRYVETRWTSNRVMDKSLSITLILLMKKYGVKL